MEGPSFLNELKNSAKGFARAAIEQGLMMGWGDEAEALIRSKVGDRTYDEALADIKREYGQYSSENPVAQIAGEFTGAALPAVAAMVVPGAQGAAPATVGRILGLGKAAAQRSYGQNLARLGTLGAIQGSIAGSGAAEPEDRFGGAVAGGVMGGGLGAAVPLAGTALSIVGRRALDAVAPSIPRSRKWALDKLGMTLNQTGHTPRDIATQIQEDLRLGVPPMIANVTPGTVRLAETVANRAGEGGTKLAEAVAKNTHGARTRVAQQIKKNISPKNFYDEEQQMLTDLRSGADTLYDQAYSVGDINDPAINRVLQEPEFKKFFEGARDLMSKRRLAEEIKPGGDPSKYAMRNLYDPQTGKLTSIPDVRTLDYIKQGIDKEIDRLYRAGESKDAGALKELRKVYVNRLDDLVPEYRAARTQYAGDMEVLDALRAGRDEFHKMDPEEIAALMKNMSDAEKGAYRVGVARNLHGDIMDPRQNINPAQRLVGPAGVDNTSLQKLQHIFETPSQMNLFLSALQRENQIYGNASQILANSRTAIRNQMRESLEGQSPVVQAAAEAVRRGPMESLWYGVANLINKGAVTEQGMDELSRLLREGNPAEVAAIVKLLEERTRKVGNKVRNIGAAGAGTTGGIIGTIPSAPLPPEGTE